MVNLRQFFAIAKIYLLGATAYPIMIAIWMLELFAVPIVILFVWLTIADSTPNVAAHKQTLINYYVLLPLIAQLVSSWHAKFLAQRIRTGQLNYILTRPLHPLYHWVNVNIIEKVLKSLILLPMVVVAAIGFKINISLSLVTIILTLILVIAGAFINFCLDIAIGSLAFWIDEVSALENLYHAAYFTLGGRVIPFFMFSPILKTTSQFLPFRYLASFPLEIMTNSLSFPEILSGSAIMATWVVVSFLLMKYAWNVGIKRYQGFGG